MRRWNGRSTPRPARTSGSGAVPRPSSSTCAAGLIDDLHLAIAPVLLGAASGSSTTSGMRWGYETVGFVASPAALHVRIARKQASS